MKFAIKVGFSLRNALTLDRSEGDFKANGPNSEASSWLLLRFLFKKKRVFVCERRKKKRTLCQDFHLFFLLPRAKKHLY